MNAAFARLQAALADVPAGTQRLAVAFSGGLDSTALLHALVESRPALAVRAIHVCHHLQPQAERWATTCAQRAADLGVDFCRLDVTVDARGQSLEAAARTARYAALEQTLGEGETLITAHHARDQAETFLLQALRGAGPHGLAAMPRIGRLGRSIHWRPWLDVAHDTIVAYGRDQQLSWVDDPSNHDPDIARSYLREAVMPGLRSRWPQADTVLSRSAAHAAEAAAAIDTLAKIDLDNAMRCDATLDTQTLAGLGRARAKQVIRRWLSEQNLDSPDHRHLQAIVQLGASRLAASPCVSFANTEVRLFDSRLYAMARLAPVGAPFEYRWSACEPLALPGGYGVIAVEPAPQAGLDLTVCARRGGERVVCAQGRHRRVKDILREARVPPWLRERMPLVYHGDMLIAVGDIWRHPRLAKLMGEEIGVFVWRDPAA